LATPLTALSESRSCHRSRLWSAFRTRWCFRRSGPEIPSLSVAWHSLSRERMTAIDRVRTSCLVPISALALRSADPNESGRTPRPL
jgi:hypothetical protein